MRHRRVYALLLLATLLVSAYPVAYSFVSGGPTNSPRRCPPLYPCQQLTPANGICTTFCVVYMENATYFPSTVNVTVGATVEWVNLDAVVHTSTSFSQNGWSSPYIEPGKSYNFTFIGLKAGQYPYHCDVHPFLVGIINLLS